MFKIGDRVITNQNAFGGVPDHEAYRNVKGVIEGRSMGLPAWVFRPDVLVPAPDPEFTLETWLLFDHEMNLLEGE